MDLYEILNKKNCFKLVCAASNENEDEVEKLVAIYSKAGCRFFDLCAKKEILDAAKKGLAHSIEKNEQKNFHFCISVGVKDDIHFSKAVISSQKCTGCAECQRVCEQKAIEKKEKIFSVIEKNCIGCHKCFEKCPQDAISFYSKNTDFSQIITEFAKSNISCIELHIDTKDEKEIEEKWEFLDKSFEGILSVCLNRSTCGDEKIISLIKKLVDKRKPFSTIVQTDGKPMSGSKDDFKTTLQTVAFAEIIQNADLPVFVMLSGGTNSKTAQLASICEINAHGIAVGSYARKIIRKYLDMPDLLQNSTEFDKAVATAKELTDKLKIL